MSYNIKNVGLLQVPADDFKKALRIPQAAPSPAAVEVPVSAPIPFVAPTPTTPDLAGIMGNYANAGLASMYGQAIGSLFQLGFGIATSYIQSRMQKRAIAHQKAMEGSAAAFQKELMADQGKLANDIAALKEKSLKSKQENAELKADLAVVTVMRAEQKKMIKAEKLNTAPIDRFFEPRALRSFGMPASA